MAARNSKQKRVLKRKLARRRGQKCAACGQARGPLTLDHRIPLSKGGTWARGNLQLLCRGCNQAKADRMPWEVA